MAPRGATLKTTSADEKPKRPRVDRGEEFETHLRSMLVPAVDRWCKDNLDAMPDREARGSVVDNLVALHTTAFETLVESVTNAYLSTATGDDSESVDCPKCGEEFDLEEDEKGNLPEPGDEIECPHCNETFECPDFDDDDDDDPDGGERATGT